MSSNTLLASLGPVHPPQPNAGHVGFNDAAEAALAGTQGGLDPTAFRQVAGDAQQGADFTVRRRLWDEPGLVVAQALGRRVGKLQALSPAGQQRLAAGRLE